jgi:hypothetical protein
MNCESWFLAILVGGLALGWIVDEIRDGMERERMDQQRLWLEGELSQAAARRTFGYKAAP